MVGYWLLAITCLTLFFGLTAAVLAGVADRWDRMLMLALAGGREPWLTWWMKLLSVAGSGLIEIPLALLLIFGLVVRGHRQHCGEPPWRWRLCLLSVSDFLECTSERTTPVT